jgi:serine phosphatase RsbU (regulator of sigma subunit)
VLDPIEISEVEVELESGQTLLLYTDGLPEADRAGVQLGEQQLFESHVELPDPTLVGLLTQIERAALRRANGRLRDDIALLALRLE